MNTALIIHSCDKYNYILPEFFEKFNQFKPDIEKLGIPVWLTTEEKPSELCANILTGKGEWSTRLKFAINTLPSSVKNIILFQEDFIVKKIDTKSIEYAIEVHDAFDYQITKLASFYEFSLIPKGYTFLENPIFQQKGGHYTMSHQPVAIFNKDFLLSTLETPNDPWHHECKVTEEINAGKYGEVNICTIGKIYNPNKSDIIDIHHAIRKGEHYAYTGN